MAAIMFSSCNGSKKVNADYDVIPKPQKITLHKGNPFILSQSTKISYTEGNKKLENVANQLSNYIEDATGYKLTTTTSPEDKNVIILDINNSIENKEGYLININPNLIKISGSTENGVFYGAQTLRKSIPAVAQGAAIELASVNIEDAPRFSYRGMHLDVGRHTYSVDSIKRYIDILALHNINNFHWHLTDDQGWRIEIKKYPKLTELGSIRKKTTIGRNSGDFDNKPYGGFFTQEEIKEVIAYADERFINVIPEIDLPGHMLAALHAYPEYGCTGGPYEVSPEFGVFDDVICAGNEDAMVFLENVLEEVIELFPSQYIHIGGDECPKTRWAKCPKCQKLIKELGIKKDSKHSAEEYLQSYVINRMEKFVNSKGRDIIGWDETLEGGLAPNATVMSWRGMGGGIEAAKQKHNVIMTPGGYVYFDHYQSLETDLEPLAIGGYTPLDRVYEFEPVPATLEGDERNYVIGCQANLWTEYIKTFSQVEYMVMPRIAALSEVQWTNPEDKNYDDFLKRLPNLVAIYDRENYNYAKHIYDVRAQYNTDTENGFMIIDLSSLDSTKEIRYTLDGTEPTQSSELYTEPLKINKSIELRACIFYGDKKSRTLSQSINLSKASLKPITLASQPNKGYTFNGAITLNDGMKGNQNYKTGRWLGFAGNDIDATIDMKEETEISKCSFSTLVVKGDWIMGATGATISVSNDGKEFKTVASKKIDILTKDDKDQIYDYTIDFEPVKAKFVKVVINSTPTLPKWHSGAGSPAFIFVDEIAID